MLHCVIQLILIFGYIIIVWIVQFITNNLLIAAEFNICLSQINESNVGSYGQFLLVVT